MNQQWDGKTERRGNTSDHDGLTRTITLLEGLVKTFEAHVLDDKTRFEKIENKIDIHAKYIYMMMGIVAILEVIFGIHK